MEHSWPQLYLRNTRNSRRLALPCAVDQGMLSFWIEFCNTSVDMLRHCAWFGVENEPLKPCWFMQIWRPRRTMKLSKWTPSPCQPSSNFFPLSLNWIDNKVSGYLNAWWVPPHCWVGWFQICFSVRKGKFKWTTQKDSTSFRNNVPCYYWYFSGPIQSRQTLCFNWDHLLNLPVFHLDILSDNTPSTKAWCSQGAIQV